jgi:hypothetical protein
MKPTRSKLSFLSRGKIRPGDNPMQEPGQKQHSPNKILMVKAFFRLRKATAGGAERPD